MLTYAILVVGLLGCIWCPIWIKNAKNDSDRRYAIFSMFGMSCMLLIGILLVSYENDILFFSQKKEYANVNINLDGQIVEDSSILHFYNDNIRSDTKSDDIEGLLGKSYTKIDSSGSFCMRYSTGEYTLDGIQSDYIFADFNKKGPKGKIRSIAWQYEKSDKKIYESLLTYLKPILGEPSGAYSSNMTTGVRWPGFELYYDDYRVAFIRRFN